MRQFALAVGFGLSLLLAAGQADAQYRYTDDKGVSKIVQYKLDVPAEYRDAAVWIGPSGIGKPALSAEQKAASQRDEAQRRIDAADAALAPYQYAERTAAQRAAEAAPSGSGGYSAAAAQQDAAMRAKAIAICQDVVNRLSYRAVPGSKTFKADAGSGLTYGTDAARFEFEKCMARQ